MTGDRLTKFFEDFIEQESIFTDKNALQSPYIPENIPHREQEIEKIASIIAPILRNEKPSNLFIYGKPGTGKTLSVKHISNKIEEIAKKKSINVKICYINCKLKKVTDTEYRLLAQLAREFGKEIPSTGLPTDEVYKIFFSALDTEKQTVLLVLDEIDQLVNKTGDEILYNLTRINTELKNSKLSIVGISNDLVFMDSVDPRVKSSLSEEEIVFPPYNALQIQDILFERARVAFKKNVIDSGVIEKCAAYAAREHGDARRALELLRVAGEIAERQGSKKLTVEHIDIAEEKIERDRILDITKTQPKQYQATLYSILLIENNIANNKSKYHKQTIYTGDVYDVYKDICYKIGLRPLTQRRVSDILGELDMMGIITAKVISKGRYGRTREISVSIPQSSKEKIEKILRNDLNL